MASDTRMLIYCHLPGSEEADRAQLVVRVPLPGELVDFDSRSMRVRQVETFLWQRDYGDGRGTTDMDEIHVYLEDR